MSQQVEKLKKKAAEFEAKRQVDKAIATYLDLFRLWDGGDGPVDVTLYNRVGDMLIRAGNIGDAMSVWEKAVDYYGDGGFQNNAIALCNKILRHSPGRTSIYYKLGKMSAQKGFKGDAKKNYLEYADRMQRANQIDEAFRALKEFADLCPDDNDIRQMLADQLAKLGRDEEALEQLQLLYERYESTGDSGAAAATVERMRAIDPAVEPKRSGPARARATSGLVFIDVDSPPQRTSRKSTSVVPPKPADLPPKRSIKSAIEGLPLIDMDEPEPPKVERRASVHVTPVALPLIEPDPEPVLEAPPVPEPEPQIEVQSFSADLAAEAPPAPDLEPIEIESTDVGSDLITIEQSQSILDAVPPEPVAIEPTEPLITAEIVDVVPTAIEEPVVAVEPPVVAAEEVFTPEPIAAEVVTPEPAAPELPPSEAAAPEPAPSEAVAPEPVAPEPAAPAPEPALPVMADVTFGASFGTEDADAGLGAPLADVESNAFDANFGGEGAVSSALSSPDDVGFGTLDSGSTGLNASEEPQMIEFMPGLDLSATVLPDLVLDGDAFALTDDPAAVNVTVDDASVSEPPRVDAPVDGPAPEELPPRPARRSVRPTMSILAQSVDLLRDRVAREPNNWQLHREFGESLLEDGDRAGGLEELEAAMVGFEREDDLESARSVADEIIRLNPLSVRHHQRRVEYAFRMSDRPRLIEAYVELADALFREGQAEKSRVVYERVLELAPDDARAVAALASFGEKPARSSAAFRMLDEPPAPRQMRQTRQMRRSVAQQRAAEAPPAPPPVTPGTPARASSAVTPPRVSAVTPVAPEVAVPVPTPEVPSESPALVPHDTPNEFASAALNDAAADAEIDAAFEVAGDHTVAPVHDEPVARASAQTPATPEPPAAIRPATPVPARASRDSEFIDLEDWLKEDERPKSTRMVVEEKAPTGDEAADFNDMLRKFKQGVAKNVEEEDHESHYDLGVAFKEMGLVEEAIHEFQTALRGPKNRVRTYEALGQCFVEKGQEQVAMTILQRALAEPGAGDDQLIGVLYLLGVSAEAVKQPAEAVKYYQRVFAVDINFRDVRKRMREIEQAGK